jgi:hypothetical protein
MRRAEPLQTVENRQYARIWEWLETAVDFGGEDGRNIVVGISGVRA